jgi:hypothetical protein
MDQPGLVDVHHTPSNWSTKGKARESALGRKGQFDVAATRLTDPSDRAANHNFARKAQ